MGNRVFVAKLAFIATFITLGVIGLGAFTRLIDAGLGCPDWPGCYGKLIVPSLEEAHKFSKEVPLVSYKAWAEMIHRYFVGTLSCFILGIILLIFSKKAYRTKTNLSLACGLIFILGYQIILGQLTVTLKLLPIVVTQHLFGGFIIASLLWLIYLTNRAETIKNIPRTTGYPILLGAYLGFILLILQIFLGAWTSTNYASLSCPDFPFCMNDSSITLQFKDAFNFFAPVGVNYEGGVLSTSVRQFIHMMHRLNAFILTIYLFGLMTWVFLKLKNNPAIVRSYQVVMGLLIVQICIGISNVLFKLPLVSAISHNLIAVFLLLSFITFIYKLQTRAVT